MTHSWHMQRRLAYEQACAGSAIENQTPPALSTYYVATTTKTESTPKTVGSSTTFSSASSTDLRRIEANSEHEARGLAFELAYKEYKDRTVQQILVMRHDPSGAGFL